MLHCEIPTNNIHNIFDHLCVTIKETDIPNRNFSCKCFLSQSKKNIELNNKSWDIFKKYTNPYEYVHTSVNNIKLSKKKPLSRAFYKLIEIIDFFNLLCDKDDKPIHSFHIAEGPGGFIEAINFYRKNIIISKANNSDTYRGLTLIDNNDNNIPGWNKAKKFVKETPNVIIDYGRSKDGNIYKLKNLDYIYEEHRNKYDIVTGDGGFDFSVDFNNQEPMALKLILCEVLYGIIMTKKQGHFIVKIFDLFTVCSYEIIYLLSCVFNEVYVSKPNTSRYGNSEKYLICKYKNVEINDTLYNSIKKLFIQIHLFDGDFRNISILKSNLSNRIINVINEVNVIFTERQIENINNTISLIMNSKRTDIIEQYKTKHISLSIEWLKKYNIPYNHYKKNNLFSNKY